MPDDSENTKGNASHAAARPSAHAIWSGTLSFGLVNIPVELHSAARGRQTSMKMVDAEGSLLGRQYITSTGGEKLDSEDIVRAHEGDDGEMVVIGDDELEAIAPDKSRDIDLRRFVPLEQIPPMCFERPYFMLPASESTKAYHLLARTLEETGRVGIGTFVMRGHQYLVALLGDGGVLRAETLRYADELRTAQDLGLPEVEEAPTARVEELAAAIDSLTETKLDPAELRDEYAESLRALAEAKAERGERVVDLAGSDDEEVEADEGGGRVVDLMKVLKERLSAAAEVTTADQAEDAPGQRAIAEHDAAAGSRSDSTKSAELAELTKDELYERAQALEIPGRSKMAKAELVKAIRAAS